MTSTVSPDLLDQRVDSLIVAQARKTPDRVAAICGATSLTYGELDRATAALARRLHAEEAAPGQLIGVHLERSLHMLIAVIAIMRAGHAYLPLDPDFPPERLALMIADSKVATVLSQSSLREAAPPGDYRRIDIDLLETPQDTGDALPEPVIGGADRIYVLYTSGSTGRPKGVVLGHRNVVNFLLSMAQEPGLTEADRLLCVTTLSFDISGLELYLPLITGATVVIAERDDVIDGERLRQLLDAHAITVMQATPTTWRLLLEADWQPASGFKALVGGEALPIDLARALAGACGEVWNMYGPTETAIWSTCYRLPPSGAPVLIGRPIANTLVYVLDKAMRPVPPGIPGELFIAGAGVARGYLDRPDLTAERFLPDPFAGDSGGTMYRTGDMGRYLSDGNIEFRQRADNQIKIRGFRIELGEIEVAISELDSVRQVVCRVFEPRPGAGCLIAYMQPEGDAIPAADEIREHLGRFLPAYMVPQKYVLVDKFPLTPNGKIDRRQLPQPALDDFLEEAYVAPETDIEKRVADVFAELLGCERVSRDAGFFDLGGHSVLAMRVISRLRKSEHPMISLRALFEHSTPRDLARVIEGLREGGHGDAAVEIEEMQF